jgi:hypothetical protein
MDYHDLQRKLFALDPTDPREDLAKLKAAAMGGAAPAPQTPEPIVESVEVPAGSMPVDKDYSVSDFAKLAGIQLNEAPQPQTAQQAQQKTGQGAKMIGNKIGAKGSAGMMSKALDKVGAGEALPANLAKQIAPFAKQLGTILGNQQLRNRFMQIIKQAENMQKTDGAPQQQQAQPQAAPQQQQAQPQAAPPQESIREALERRLKEFELKRK